MHSHTYCREVIDTRTDSRGRHNVYTLYILLLFGSTATRMCIGPKWCVVHAHAINRTDIKIDYKKHIPVRVHVCTHSDAPSSVASYIMSPLTATFTGCLFIRSHCSNISFLSLSLSFSLSFSLSLSLFLSLWCCVLWKPVVHLTRWPWPL
jgi:hypothetical protein